MIICEKRDLSIQLLCVFTCIMVVELHYNSPNLYVQYELGLFNYDKSAISL